MVYDQLNKELAEVFKLDENEIRNAEFEVKGLSLMKLRDILMGLGRIYKEDIENNKYYVVIGGGTSKRNKVTAILKLMEEKLYIAIFAKEGLIDQNTCGGVIDELKKQIDKSLR